MGVHDLPTIYPRFRRAGIKDGVHAEAGATEQSTKEGAARPDADFPPGVGGENHRRCVAGAIPGPVAQSNLGARAARGLTTDERPPNPAIAALLRIAQCHIHGSGWLVAHRLGTG